MNSCVLEVNGKTYTGQGRTARQAHSNACMNVLLSNIKEYLLRNSKDAEAKKFRRKPFEPHLQMLMLDSTQNHNGKLYSGVGDGFYTAKFDACVKIAWEELKSSERKEEVDGAWALDTPRPLTPPPEDEKGQEHPALALKREFDLVFRYRAEMDQTFNDRRLRVQSMFTSDGQKFIGAGETVLDAQMKAAQKALRFYREGKALKMLELDEVCCGNGESSCDESMICNGEVVKEETQSLLPSPEETEANEECPETPPPTESFGEKIRNAVVDKYRSLQANKNFGVLAGIVLSEGDRLEVVSLATGSRSLDPAINDSTGSIVVDCHAEVLARRGFLRYLYAQTLAARSDADSIFERHSRDLELKEGVQFHFFVSTPPCGSNSGGKLRAKYEQVTFLDGEPVAVQPLRTMSCADKLARWNVLGLQGSLLSMFVPPIYIASITVCGQGETKCFEEAFGGRIKDALDQLPDEHKLNSPVVHLVTDLEGVLDRASGLSGVWSANNVDHFEILDAKTGRDANGNVSTVAKKKIYQLFYEFLGTFGEISPLWTDISYGQAKQEAEFYQIAKKQLLEAFDKSLCGKWIQAPLQHQHFKANRK